MWVGEVVARKCAMKPGWVGHASGRQQRKPWQGFVEGMKRSGAMKQAAPATDAGGTKGWWYRGQGREGGTG